MRRALFYGLLAASALAVRAGAQTPQIVKPESERYALQPTEGGALRLDKETGAVSFCAVKNGVAACRLAAEERAALDAEIARLREENARLKTAAAPKALPGEEEFEKALSFTERFLRRIMRLFKEETAPGGTL